MSENLIGGFIGGGEQAGYLFRHGWSRVPGVQVAACYDLNPETARRFGETYGLAVASSIEELASRVDLLAVCTPPGVHAENVMQALAAPIVRGRVVGVHCEKPSALTLTDHDAMVRTAHARKAVLTFGYDRLFSAAGWIAGMVGRGVLGEIEQVRVIWHRFDGIPKRGAFLRRDLSGGGPGFDLLPHLVAIVMYILQNPDILGVVGKTHHRTIEAAGTMGNLEMQGDVEDSILGIAGLRFRGAPVTMSFSVAWDQPIPGDEFEVRIVGTRGTATLTREPLPNDDERYVARAFAAPSPQLGGLLPQTSGGQWAQGQAFRVREHGPLFELIPPVTEPSLADCRAAQLDNLADTVRAVRAGQPAQPLVTPDLARRVLELVLAAYDRR